MLMSFILIPHGHGCTLLVFIMHYNDNAYIERSVLNSYLQYEHLGQASDFFSSFDIWLKISERCFIKAYIYIYFFLPYKL